MKGFTTILLIIFSSFLSLNLWAIPSVSYDFKSLSNTKDTKLDAEIGFQSNQLVDEVGEVPGNQYFSSLKFDYDTQDSSWARKVFKFSANYNNEDQLMYSLEEGKIQFNGTSSDLTIGRTILDWSIVDKEWGLGKVNNRINFDYFEPGQEGLIGVVYNKKFKNNISIGVLGSMFYVPETNPGLDIDKDGRTVKCLNPWCNAPASSAQIDGKNIPIYYTVNYPEISDVVLRYSIGLQLGYEYERVSLKAYGIRKPENSISVTAEITYDTEVDEIQVEATPQFYYHDVKGTDIVYKFSNEFSAYGSFISIDPKSYPDGDEPYIEYTGIKPRKKNEEYLSTGLKLFRNKHAAHLGYIARVSDFDKENDLLLEYPRWNQAIQLQYSASITPKIKMGVDLKYDMLTEDRLSTAKASYSFTKNLVAGLGINIIGTSEDEVSYWSKYENNDSVYSSLKYVF